MGRDQLGQRHGNMALMDNLGSPGRTSLCAVALLAALVADGCGETGGIPADSSAATPPDAGIEASDGACAAEFFQGTVQFPDGTMHEACSPANADGIVVNFVRLAFCAVVPVPPAMTRAHPQTREST